MKHRVFRILATALVLMLICGAALAEVVTTANVWMRTGPGLKYDQVTSLSEGKKLTYLGETSVDERGVAWSQTPPACRPLPRSHRPSRSRCGDP